MDDDDSEFNVLITDCGKIRLRHVDENDVEIEMDHSGEVLSVVLSNHQGRALMALLAECLEAKS